MADKHSFSEIQREENRFKKQRTKRKFLILHKHDCT